MLPTCCCWLLFDSSALAAFVGWAFPHSIGWGLGFSLSFWSRVYFFPFKEVRGVIGNTALFQSHLCCESPQNFIRAYITAVSEICGCSYNNPSLLCWGFLSHFLGVNRDIRGGSDLSQTASTASGGTNVSQALGCGEVLESWLLLLLNDHISYCCTVSFSFCAVHIINNTPNVEYFKRWLLLLGSIPMKNTDVNWDKSALSVFFFFLNSMHSGFFLWIFLKSIFF